VYSTISIPYVSSFRLSICTKIVAILLNYNIFQQRPGILPNAHSLNDPKKYDNKIVVIARLDRGIQKALDARLRPEGMTDKGE
jgi:hypothetical protein